MKNKTINDRPESSGRSLSKEAASPVVLEEQLKPDWTKISFNGGIYFIVFALLAWSFLPAEMQNAVYLWTDAGNMAEFGKDFLRPDFHEWEMYLGEMLITVQIAIWGTALSVVLGIPFALLSSENIVPLWVVQPIRRLMDMARATNEIVFAMLFVVAVGLGPFAGVMAIFIHNTGIISKLFSEAASLVVLFVFPLFWRQGRQEYLCRQVCSDGTNLLSAAACQTWRCFSQYGREF